MQNNITILKDLVCFQTDGNRDNLQKCMAYVENYIKSACPNSVIVRIPTNGADNLIIGLNVEKLHNIQKGLMLCGHLDVVTGRPEQFIPVLKDGKIYGRGTTDMKGAISCFLSLVPFFGTLNMPVIICLTCDEETDILGIRDVCAFLKANNIRPQLTILGEPTDNKLGICSSGIKSYKTVVTGISAHSSVPQQGVNAIFAAANIIQRLEQTAQKMLSNELYLNVGHITGGENLTKIPNHAEIEWGFRYMNEKDADGVWREYNEIVTEVLSQYPRAEIQTVPTELFLGFTAADTKTADNLCRILHTKTSKLYYTSEAGYLSENGQNVFLFGPSKIELAHADGEYITPADLDAYQTLLQKLAEYINGSC